jgi:hypothetical protein
MKYVIEVSSDVMIYVPSFTKIRSGIRKLIREGIHRDTDPQGAWGYLIHFF